MVLTCKTNMRQYDPHTGLPIPTKQEWKDGVTPDDLEEDAIMRTLGIILGIVIFCVGVLVV